jgi:hypothetical protein
MKTSGLWAIGLVVGLAIITLALGLTAENSKRRLLAYKKDLERRGEVLDVTKGNIAAPEASLARAREVIRHGEDVAKVLRTSRIRFLSPPASSPTDPRPVFHREILSRVSGTVPYTWSEAEADFRALEPALSRIRKITAQGPLEIHPDYSLGHAALLEGVDAAQSASWALFAQSYLHMHKGEPEKAAANIVSALRLSAMIVRQRTLIAGIIGAGLQNVAFGATWDLLQADNLPVASLLVLQREWNDISIAEALAPSLRAERSFSLTVFAHPQPERLGLAPPVGPAKPTAPFDIRGQAVILSWKILYRHSDEQQYLEALQSVFDAVPANPRKGPWEQACRTAIDEFQRVGRANPLSGLISKILIPTENAVLLPVAAQAQAHLTATAIALRRHQLAYDRLPQSLDELRPEFSDETSLTDPFNGQHLRYRKIDSTKYLLYSVGGNFTDDHGTATHRSLSKSADIVWPQVAP